MQVRSHRRRAAVTFTAGAMATLGVLIAPAGVAHAASTVAIPQFHAHIYPNADYSASAAVWGGLSPRYTITLTGVGVENAPLLAAGPTYGFGIGAGNAATTSIPGGFTAWNGSTTYNLTWTGVTGSTASFQLTCQTVLWNFTCNGPNGVDLLVG